MAKNRRQNSVESTYKDTIAKLKATCRNQQKELARIRKELERRSDVSDDYKELLNEPKADSIEVELPTRCCPRCKGALENTDLGIFTLIRCSSCDYRFRQPKESASVV